MRKKKLKAFILEIGSHYVSLDVLTHYADQVDLKLTKVCWPLLRIKDVRPRTSYLRHFNVENLLPLLGEL